MAREYAMVFGRMIPMSIWRDPEFTGLTNKVTYACSCNTFTVTDTGDEAKRAWLRHLLSVEVGA
jgi:hypothetical protein